jgi:hypothetical protein
VIQERCLNTLLRRRIFTGEHFMPTCLLDQAAEYLQIANVTLLDRFRHATVDNVYHFKGILAVANHILTTKISHIDNI